MKPNFVIIHGVMASPKAHWFPWLKSQLLSHGLECDVPKMPTPENQKLDVWLKTLNDLSIVRQNSILIGHSIGAAFILRFLQQSNLRGLQTILLAPFVDKINLEPYDILNASFIQSPDDPFDWRKIQLAAHKILCIAGENDPYVPLSLSKFVANKLEVKLEVIQNGQHLNSDAGFIKFPRLLDLCLELANLKEAA